MVGRYTTIADCIIKLSGIESHCSYFLFTLSLSLSLDCYCFIRETVRPFVHGSHTLCVEKGKGARV